MLSRNRLSGNPSVNSVKFLISVITSPNSLIKKTSLTEEVNKHLPASRLHWIESDSIDQ